MKRIHTPKPPLKSGVTLIELTVVIIVMLTLISVLFFLGAGYIKSSNRTVCLTNQSKLQKAMRGYQSLNQLEEASTFQWTSLNDDGYIADATLIYCPSDKQPYVEAPEGVVPPIGDRVAPCLDSNYATDHTPTELALW